MRISTFGLLVSLTFALISNSQAQVFVKAGATGAGDGSSWTDAYTDLQDAIDAAPGGAELWVAAGTYTPSRTTSGNTSDNKAKERTFFINKSLSLYGGFAGTESQLAQRNWNSNHAIIDGDLGNGKRVYQLFRIQQQVSVTIDGFTLQRAEAEGPSDQSDGAGILAHNLSTLTLRNLDCYDLEAKRDGGILHITQLSQLYIEGCGFYGGESKKGGALHADNLSNLTIVNSYFCGNEADGGSGMGGAIYATQLGSFTLTGSAFTNNEAENHGGAIYLKNGSATTLTNNTFTNNEADNHGGAVYLSSYGAFNAYNTIFWDNEDQNGSQHVAASVWYTNASLPSFRNCILKGSQGSGANWPATLTDAGNNLDQNPLFASLAGPDGQDCSGDEVIGVSSGSPALNNGDPNAPNLPAVDLNNQARVQDGLVDIGAAEGVAGSTFPVEWLDLSVEQRGSQGIVSWRTAQEINTSHFVLERTYDQQDLWLALGEVAAAGFSDQPQAYSFTDTDLPQGAHNVYYRLRQIDLDGAWAHSPTLTLTMDATRILQLTAFPNPSEGHFQVSLTQSEAEAGTLRVLDAMGRSLYARYISAATSVQATIDLPQVSPGLYLVEWVTPLSRHTRRIEIR
ncbi:MAG: T9SS C-terminal target domain-containing protein [Bacteroidetes bacterium]|nr:MAG: T9SS C-terminal target domain-containing protein [Bacteroidota bacterium]